MLLHSLKRKKWFEFKIQAAQKLNLSSLSSSFSFSFSYLLKSSSSSSFFWLPNLSFSFPSPNLSTASLSLSFSKAELIHSRSCQPHHHFAVPVVFPKANPFAFWNFIPLFSQSNALENFTYKGDFSRLSSKNLIIKD